MYVYLLLQLTSQIMMNILQFTDDNVRQSMLQSLKKHFQVTLNRAECSMHTRCGMGNSSLLLYAANISLRQVLLDDDRTLGQEADAYCDKTPGSCWILNSSNTDSVITMTWTYTHYHN